MASGKLGSAALAANTDTVVYIVPNGTTATVNIAIVNRGTFDALVYIAVAPNGVPTDADYIEYGAVIPANGVLERTAIVAGAGEHVVVRSSNANCSVRVFGFEG